MAGRMAAVRPDLVTERAFWAAGLRLVAGVDEVGRGAMAGPLVAAAVVLPPEIDGLDEVAEVALAGVRDSKLLSREQRERLLPAICEVAQEIGVGVVDVAELDLIGVGPANRLAMQRAVLALPDIQKQLNDRGQIPVVSPPPAELEAFVTNEMKRWGDIVRASGQAGSL